MQQFPKKGRRAAVLLVMLAGACREASPIARSGKGDSGAAAPSSASVAVVPGGASGSAAPSSSVSTPSVSGFTRCFVRAEHARLEEVSLQITSDRTLLLRVLDAGVTARPAKNRDESRLKIGGIIAFEGRAKTSSLAFRVSRPMLVAGGLLGLTERSRLHVRGHDSESVTARVVLGPGLEAREVTLPCDALTLEPAPRESRGLPGTVPAGMTRVEVVGTSLHVAPHAGAAGALVVSRNEGASVPLRAGPARDRFREIWIEGRAGEQVSGWVAATELADARPPQAPKQDRALIGSGSSCADAPKPQAGATKPSRLRKGARVYGAARDPPFADVTRDVDVLVREGVSGWKRLVRLPGIEPVCGKELDSLWVREADVEGAREGAR